MFQVFSSFNKKCLKLLTNFKIQLCISGHPDSFTFKWESEGGDTKV